MQESNCLKYACWFGCQHWEGRIVHGEGDVAPKANTRNEVGDGEEVARGAYQANKAPQHIDIRVKLCGLIINPKFP